MNEKRKSLIYRPSFVVILVVILSLIFSFLSVNINFLGREYVNYNDILYIDIGDIIGNMYGYNGYYIKGDKEYIDYLFNGSLVFSLSEGTDEEDEYKYVSNISHIENDGEIEEIKNKFMEDENRYWFNISISRGDFNLESNIKDQGKFTRELSILEEDLPMHFDQMINELSENSRVNLFVSFNPADRLLMDRLDFMNFFMALFINFLILIVVSLFIFIILTTFMNYKKARDNGTFDFLINIPIELYMIVFFILFFVNIGISAVLSFMIFNYESLAEVFEYLMVNKVYLFIVTGLTFIAIDFYLIYMVLIFKSLYYEGFRSFIFTRSIVFRFFRSIFSSIKWVYDMTLGRIDIGNKWVLISIYIILLIFSFFMGTITSSLLVIFICFVLSTILFIKIYEIYKDYKEIEKASGEISRGNYSIYIDNGKNKFKKLAGNLNNTVDSLSLAVQRELKSERMKTELITNVSHDLKTPLTSIINYSDLIVNEDNGENIKDYARIINDKSLKLKVLIDSLFDFSKITTSNISFDKMDIDFVELVNMSIGEWTDKFNEKDLEIISNFPDSQVIIPLDGQFSSRILDNIFSNIYKYALENTRVYVDIFERDGEVIFISKNISKYPLNISVDELLERFTRGDSSRSTEGSGLGLSIAQSLTEQQNGSFKIDIKGDLFEVRIGFKK